MEMYNTFVAQVDCNVHVIYTIVPETCGHYVALASRQPNERIIDMIEIFFFISSPIVVKGTIKIVGSAFPRTEPLGKRERVIIAPRSRARCQISYREFASKRVRHRQPDIFLLMEKAHFDVCCTRNDDTARIRCTRDDKVRIVNAIRVILSSTFAESHAATSSATVAGRSCYSHRKNIGFTSPSCGSIVPPVTLVTVAHYVPEQ